MRLCAIDFYECFGYQNTRIMEVIAMRPTTFSAPIQFYAPAPMADAVRAKAEREGRSISEVIRSALRRELQDAA